MAQLFERRQLHVLVPDPVAPAVLVDDAGALPSVRLQRSGAERLATAVRRMLRETWGLDAPILELHGDDDSAIRAGRPVDTLVVVEAPAGGWVPPADCRWLVLDGTDPEAPPAVRPRAAELVAEWRGARPVPEQRVPWARPDWHRRAGAWIGRQLGEQGRPPIRVEQFRHGDISAVLRVETTRGAAFFKAVFPLFHHEPAVSAMLDRELPGLGAGVLAVDEAEGWLLLDDAGTACVADAPDADAATIRRLVEAQRWFVGRADELVGVGCPVRPLADLARDLAAALADPAVRDWVDVTDERAGALVSWVDGAVADVEALGYPDTLVHGDFHPENAMVDGPVIFDWSDAAVAHPLVDAMTWAGWLSDDPERGERGWGVFLDAWSDVCPIDRVQPLRPLLAALTAGYHTVSYAGIVGALEPLLRADMASGLVHYFRLLDRAVPS